MPFGVGRPLSGPGTAPQIHPAAVEIMRQIRRWTIPDEQPVTAVMTDVPLLIGFPPGTIPITTITTGIWGGLTLDFPGRITGVKIRPWDSSAGSITFDIQKAPVGTSNWASIVGSSAPAISGSADPYFDNALVNWNTMVNRGDDFRFHVTAASGFTLVTISLRVRRLDLTAQA